MLVKSVKKMGLQPFDRFTEYFATPKEAQSVLDAPMEEGGFNEKFGVVQKEFEIYE